LRDIGDTLWEANNPALAVQIPRLIRQAPSGPVRKSSISNTPSLFDARPGLTAWKLARRRISLLPETVVIRYGDAEQEISDVSAV
jgi:hypothetical protein